MYVIKSQAGHGERGMLTDRVLNTVGTRCLGMQLDGNVDWYQTLSVFRGQGE